MKNKNNTKSDLYRELDLDKWASYRHDTLSGARAITLTCLLIIPLIELCLLTQYRGITLRVYIETMECRYILLGSGILIILVSIIYRTHCRKKAKQGLTEIAMSLNVHFSSSSISGMIKQLRGRIAELKKAREEAIAREARAEARRQEQERKRQKEEKEQRRRNEIRADYFCIDYSGLSNIELNAAIANAEAKLESVRNEAFEYHVSTTYYKTFNELQDAVKERKAQTLKRLQRQATELGVNFYEYESIPILKCKVESALEEKRRREEQEKAEQEAQRKRIIELQRQATKLGVDITMIKDSEQQLTEAIAKARQLLLENLKREAIALGITLAERETSLTLRMKILKRKEEIEKEKKAAEEARLAEQRRKEEAERQRKLLLDEAGRYGIPVYGRSESAIKHDIDKEKVRLAQIEKERKAEEERKRQEREKEEKRQRLLNCTSSWYEPSRSYLKCFSMYNYYPTTCGWEVGQEDWDVRNLIWDFKANPHKPMPLPIIMARHKNSADEVAKSMSRTLRHFFGRDVSALTLLCIPASTQEITQRRYEDFSKMVCDELGMSNAYGHVKVAVDGGAKHLGQSNSAQYSIEKNYFKDRYVILFDDVITSGDSMENFRRGLESLGAHVIGGFSIGRTRHEPQSSHPINNIP